MLKDYLKDKKCFEVCKNNLYLQHGTEIDIDSISLEDEKTYEGFQRGDTIGIFQFSSDGMRKHLKMLKPDKFEDLIEPTGLPKGFPLVPFLNGILYRLVYNRKKAYLFNNYLLFYCSVIVYVE